MKISTRVEPFVKAWNTVSRLCRDKSPTEHLRCVRLIASSRGVVLQATDMVDYAIVTVDADVAAPGTLVIPYDRMSRFLSELTCDSVAIEDLDGDVLVSSQWAKVKLRTLASKKFTEPPEIPKRQVMIPAKRLRKMFAICAACAERQESNRFALGAVAITCDDGRCMATGADGRRLAVVAGDEGGWQQGSNDTAFLVPMESAGRIASLLDDDDDAIVSVMLDSRHAYFDLGRIRYWVRLMEGRYPDTSKIGQPQDATGSAQCSPVELASAVRSAAIGNGPDDRGVWMRFEQDKVVVRSSTDDAMLSASSECACTEATGEFRDEILLDARFVTDLCVRIDPKQPLYVSASTNLKPAWFRQGADLLYCVMPMAKD